MDNALRSVPYQMSGRGCDDDVTRATRSLIVDDFLTSDVQKNLLGKERKRAWWLLKGAGSRDVNKLLSKRRFCCIFDRPYHRDFRLLSQNESVILKIDSCTSKRNRRNTHTLYDCRDIGGFLEATLVWIHPIHQNLCRTQWPRVGKNADSRDNRFVYSYVTLPL